MSPVRNLGNCKQRRDGQSRGRDPLLRPLCGDSSWLRRACVAAITKWDVAPLSVRAEQIFCSEESDFHSRPILIGRALPLSAKTIVSSVVWCTASCIHWIRSRKLVCLYGQHFYARTTCRVLFKDLYKTLRSSALILGVHRLLLRRQLPQCSNNSFSDESECMGDARRSRALS